MPAGIVERETVDECPEDDCEASFLGMTPHDMREHAAEAHNPLYGLVYFPAGDSDE